MSFWSNLQNVVAGAFAPNENEFKAGLTPENALEELKRFNQNTAIQKAARSIDQPVLDYEWLLNSFQYVSSVVSNGHILDMATYMNNCSVFRNVAPHFYKTTTWNHVFYVLTTRCLPAKRPILLSLMEDGGHMQGIVQAQWIDPSVSLRS